MKKIHAEKGSKKIKGCRMEKKSGEKMPNQVTKLPEIAETLIHSGQKAGNLKQIQVTGSYLKLPGEKREIILPEPIVSYLSKVLIISK